jgi:DNA replication and repair protein RecF
VRLKHLALRHFRNLGVQELEVPDEGFALVGDNAQGKTNVLEAVYYLETFRSFRGARDDQLVAFDEDVFRLVARAEADEPGREPVEVAAAFERKGRRKKVTVDGLEPDRLSGALGRLGVVVFSPADVLLVNDGPGERRRFLDMVLSLNERGYLAALQQYRHTLSQRNAALRDEQPAELVDLWNEGLVSAGGRVIDARARWIDERAPLFSSFYEEISGGRAAVPRYRPSVPLEGASTPGQAAEAFRAALRETRARERRVGATVVGPHRDEFSISLEGDDALEVREYGSGGQRRTAALSLRLVEADTIRGARGLEPIVLLDDVFAELDEGRSERILNLMEGGRTGQVILTAPKESDVRLRRDVLPRWRIVGGRIEA